MTVVWLRPARPADREWLRALRNSPAVRRQSTTTQPISQAAHAAWFAETLASASRCCLIATVGRRRIGYARVDGRRMNGSRRGVVSIALVPRARGRGRGRALLAALDRAARGRFGQLEANIRTSNVASLVCFLRAGYRLIRADRRWAQLVREL